MVISMWNTKLIPFSALISTLLFAGFMVVFFPVVNIFPYSHYIIIAGIALLWCIGVYMVIPREKTLLDELKNLEGFGAPVEEVMSWLANEEKKLSRIAEYVPILVEVNKNKVRDIMAIAERLFDNIKIDPSSYRQARRVVGLYLDSTLEVLEKVKIIKQKAGDSEDISETINKLTIMLEDMEDSFRGLSRKMIERDVTKIDVDLEVMRDRLRSDGLTVRNG